MLCKVEEQSQELSQSATPSSPHIRNTISHPRNRRLKLFLQVGRKENGGNYEEKNKHTQEEMDTGEY